MTSGSNCRHLNKPQTEEARRSIRPAYHGLPVKLQHCPQERVWDSAQEWQRQPHALRRAPTETMVDSASDPRARFVGIETHLNAGGLLERDLFQPQHEGYLTELQSWTA